MLPPGYTARPIALTEVDGLRDGLDVDLAFAVALAAEIPVTEVVDTTREQMRVLFAGPDAVPAESLLVFDREGHAVGVLAIECDPSAHEVFADAYVVPEVASVLAGVLVGWGVDAAQRLAGPAEGWHVDAGCYAGDSVYTAALAAAGYERVRRFWRMDLGLADVSGEEPAAPPGVTRTVASSEEDLRLVHALRDATFGDHFGSVEHPFEEWIRHHTETRSYAPDRWWIAWESGIPVGLCIEDDSRAEFDSTYVRTIGVVPAARGRGIARWLLRCVAADAVRAGLGSVSLAVDSENTTGATALYESVGMRAVQVIDVHRRPLG